MSKKRRSVPRGISTNLTKFGIFKIILKLVASGSVFCDTNIQYTVYW